MYEYKQGDQVLVTSPFEFVGEIVGCANINGQRAWIVRVTDGSLPNEAYPFDTTVAFECNLYQSAKALHDYMKR